VIRRGFTTEAQRHRGEWERKGIGCRSTLRADSADDPPEARARRTDSREPPTACRGAIPDCREAMTDDRESTPDDREPSPELWPSPPGERLKGMDGDRVGLRFGGAGLNGFERGFFRTCGQFRGFWAVSAVRRSGCSSWPDRFSDRGGVELLKPAACGRKGCHGPGPAENA
jgi:hypothetical protein